MAQPSWATIESTIQSVIASAAAAGPSALASNAVVWSFQNYNAPASPYIRLSLGAVITVGVDFVAETLLPAWLAETEYDATDRVTNDDGRTYRCTTGGISAASGGPTGTGASITDGTCVWAFVAAGGEIAETLGGVREVPLVIEGFGVGLVDQVAVVTARAMVDDVVSRLRLPTLRGTLAAVGVTPFDPGATNWIPDVVDTAFRGRAIAEVRCRMPARAVAEYTTYIESISTDLTAEGGASGDIEETIETPQPPAPPSPPIPRVYGLLQTGQSLSVGYPGGTIIGTLAVPDSYRFTGGIPELGQLTPWAIEDISALVPLTESLVVSDGFALGETGMHSAAKILNATSERRYMVASVGTQSLGIASRDKTAGNDIYANTLAVVSAMKSRVEGLGLLFGGIEAIFEVGGETDAANGNYYADLLQYQADLSTDIIAITGQATPSPIPMVLSQVVAIPASILPSDSSCEMVRAARNFPTRFVLSVNKEILDNYVPNTGHLLPAGYRAMGAYNARALLEWQVTGESLVPMPDLATVTRSGQTYTIDFFVATPPLLLVTSYVSQQVAPQLYGWSVYTAGIAERVVDDVTIGDGPNGAGTRVTVHVTVDPGVNSYLRYAVGRGDDGRTTQLPTSGPRGNLRDSTVLVDAEGNALPGNYAPRFQVQVA